MKRTISRVEPSEGVLLFYAGFDHCGLTCQVEVIIGYD